ncbi:MAG: peptidoglycan DD-metalloendopeptidase family protein [Anaerolineales bacterium]|nr:peptidoglycan DD-metalloendopeptidase family protein [Anaerolineales bacterium]
MYKRLLVGILFSLFVIVAPASAQGQANGPIYIVESGDTLWAIASRFNIDLDALIAANNLEGTGLAIGQELLIPGLEGVSGVLRTETVAYGDTLRSLQRRTQAPINILHQLNRLVSPTELYAGVSLIIPQNDTLPALSSRISLAAGETLLETAIAQGDDVWTLTELNHLAGSWAALPGDVLYSPTADADEKTSGLPAIFKNVQVDGLPFYQGGTAEINVQLTQEATLSGSLADYTLKFFPNDEGGLTALQGVHAMIDPGVYPLKLEASLPNSEKQSFEQMVLILSGYYPNDPILVVPPETLDPSTTQSEEDELIATISQASSVRQWHGVFENPSVYEDCFTSRYGNRREYRASDGSQTYFGFHSGLDFGGGEGLQITAPAAGTVVFAGPTIVRGNATIIDHGWGVFSGYWHQSESFVEVGQQVEAGDVIGLVGGTGRVTGAHLHWEVWVNGVQVNPMVWLEQSFP